MDTDGLKQRVPHLHAVADIKRDIKPDLGAGATLEKPEEQQQHPGGAIRHGLPKQAVRVLWFFVYFVGTCCWYVITNIWVQYVATALTAGSSIFTSQVVGAPLYLINKDWFYAWMAVTKQHFGLLVTTTTQWWSPTVVRVSGDKSVRGQLRQTEDGRLECDFPERLVLMANHQIYTDWLYLWWIAYTARMHGHIYIILKESLKWIPVIGWGMQFYGFIFLSRKWASDKERFQYRLSKLKAEHHGPMSGTAALDPMWLLIFPEGTNLSGNGRESSRKWAEKVGLKDLQHALLPRSTGLQFCLEELKGTVDWVYDCTVAYEGIPRGQYGQDIFTLRSTYFQGRPPKSVNMYWRRFHVSSIPINDSKAFEEWVRQRWVEKDELLEQYMQTGRFPASESQDAPLTNGHANGFIKKEPAKGAGYVETDVRPSHPLEVLQIFAPVATMLLILNIMYKFYNLVTRGVFGE